MALIYLLIGVVIILRLFGLDLLLLEDGRPRRRRCCRLLLLLLFLLHLHLLLLVFTYRIALH